MSDVEMVISLRQIYADALANNKVDAIVVWEPHCYNARQLLGDQAIRLPSSEIYRETFNFMAMKDFIKNNSES